MENLKGLDFSNLVNNIQQAIPQFNIPNIEPIRIDPKSTVQYKIQEQTEIILKQNKYLEDNYNKLNDLYELKVLELEESKKDLKKAKRTNNIMLWVTIIACLAAVVSAVISSLIVIGVI